MPAAGHCPRHGLPVLTALVGVLVVGVLLAISISPTVQAVPAHTGETEQQNQSMLLVLDSSGSMREPAGGGDTRFQAATAAVDEVIGGLPPTLDVGLRVYGAEIADGPGSCRDSELAVPVGPLDRRALRSAVQDAAPKGNTPIAYSLQQAAKDLPADGQRTVVLISDGEESCGGNPCAVARSLSAQGLDVRVDVIGFQVSGAARDQLTCIAQAGRGTYYDAPDASALSAQLERLSARAAREYRAAGTPVEGAPTPAEAPMLEPGQYLDTIGDGGNVETYRTQVSAGGTLHAAATIRPTTPNLTDTERVGIEVSGADGICATQGFGSVGAFNVLTPVTAWLTVDGEEIDRCGGGPLVVTVTREDRSGVKPLEVILVAEPRVDGADRLPPAPPSGSYDAKAQVDGPVQEAVGAPSFSAAPVLQPGVYRDSILVGETLIYAVELTWGEQLVCDVRYGRNSAVDEALGFSSPPVSVRLFGPTRGEIIDFSQQQSTFYEGSRPVTEHAASVPVRYNNREGELFQQSASIAGTYYCVTHLNHRPESGAGEIPLTVTIDVVGEPEDAPPYVEADADPTETAPAQPDAETTGPASAEAASDEAAESGPGLLTWSTVLLALLAGALLALVAYRRR